MGAVWTIVVAAGRGARFGSAKQYEPLGGRRVLDWSLDSARAVSDGVVLVVPPELATHREAAADAVVAGGTTRSESVRRGLAAVPGDAEVVVVHDGARPLAEAALFAAAVEAVRSGADAAVAAVAVSDTIKRTAAGVVVETLERDELVAVQTPQAFRASVLRDAHAVAGDATDDAALVEARGAKVVVVAGSPTNIKITHPLDLVVAEALLSGR